LVKRDEASKPHDGCELVAADWCRPAGWKEVTQAKLALNWPSESQWILAPIRPGAPAMWELPLPMPRSV